ncbi:cohesin subunit SA-3 [Eudromia elegans]
MPPPAATPTPVSLVTRRDLGDSDSGSDFEATLELRGKRGPRRAPATPVPAKRPRSSPQAPDSPDLGDSDFEATSELRGKRGPRRAPATPVPAKRPRSGGTDLFEAIRGGRAAVETLVDEWLEGYKRDPEAAFVELLNCFARACGCTGTVTLDMFRTLPNADIIERLAGTLDETSSESPAGHPEGAGRRLRGGLCELVVALVARGRHGAVLDGFLPGALAALLTGLAASPVRAFRHAGTLAALKLVTALVPVAVALGQLGDKNARQLEAERAKEPGRRAPERLEGLQEQRRELQEQQEEVETLMNAIFKGVFVHRYRDIVPEIRAACMEELGHWMRSSDAFVTDGHLKYLGWTLHDKQPQVRLQCVRALQWLYGRPDAATHLELFTGRFKTRMVAMVLDKDPEVAVEVVKLLTTMAETMEGTLTEAECQRVCVLVYAAGRALAATAGRFLCARLLARQREVAAEPSRDGDNRSFLLLLLDFFLQSELHEHAAYLVDSVWDSAGSRLRDWDTLSGLLLEKGPGAGLSDHQERGLVEILVAAARQASAGQPPPGRGPARKRAAERSRLSHCLIPALPQLLAKFSADADKVAPLLELLQCFDLRVYCTGRLEKSLERLLGQLQELVEKHAGTPVLEAAARGLHGLCVPELALGTRAEVARGRLADRLGQRLRHGATELLLRAPSLDDEDVYGVAATLKRLAALFNAHDLTRWQLLEPCSQLLQRAVDTGEVPPQVVVPAITCVHFHLLWELSRVPSADATQEQLRRLKSQATSFCSQCQSCLCDGDPGVREQAFLVLGDLLLVLAPLAVRPDAGLRSQLAGVLEDHVFGDVPASPVSPSPVSPMSPRGDEGLPRRRLLLAAFCKLLLYGVLEASAASDVFKHYAKFYRDYGDIIKETMDCARRRDPRRWAATLLLSLQQRMTELLLQEGPELRRSGGFRELRELARRFSLFFVAPHGLRHRQLLLGLHRDGIRFALRPLNLPFLEVLAEFSARLPPPDKALVLAFLQETQPPAGPSLELYRGSLRAPGDTGATKRRRGDGSSPGSRPASPALTSTALRGPRAPGGPRLPGLSPRSSSVIRSQMDRLSLMEEEEATEEEEPSSEGGAEQHGGRLRDLFDSTILGIEDI